MSQLLPDLIDRETEPGRVDTTLCGIYELEDEAENKASEVYDDISEDDRINTQVCVGVITNFMLREAGDWESFRTIDIVSVYEAEEQFTSP